MSFNRLTTAAVLLLVSLLASILAGVTKVGVVVVCGVGGVGFGLNAWGLRTAVLDECQAKWSIGAARREFLAVLLSAAGFTSAIVAIVISVTL